jgi:LysR family transcriptional regulator, glycine cleavage system transcriptional activator
MRNDGSWMRRLPPLSTLRSFEAAARHLSFSKAADELHVTHGAVSRAISHLEDHLGIELFTRKTRAVQLTQTGIAYAASVRDILDRLAAATALIVDQQSVGVLNVSTVDSFAAKWLIPRLYRFRQKRADIDVRLATSEKLADFVNDGIDIAIRYGRGRYAGLTAELLMMEEVTPVSSPKLSESPHPLKSPADLKHHTLIHDDFAIDWAMWLRMAGVEGVDAHRGPRFQSSVHAVQAAVQGDGVVLGRSALVADDLRAGRLVRPFKLSLPADLAYYIVYPTQAAERPKIQAFRDWLLEEARFAPDEDADHLREAPRKAGLPAKTST